MIPIKTLPPIVGGEEQSYRFLFKQPIIDTTRYEILDLTDFAYSVEVSIGGEVIRTFTEDDGIERLEDNPTADTGAHYRWTLSETETERLPLGPSLVKLIRVSPDDVKKIDLVYLKRVA